MAIAEEDMAALHALSKQAKFHTSTYCVFKSISGVVCL